MTFTTPPIADELYRSAPGPCRTSIRSAVNGLIATAWSGSVADKSRLLIPSMRTGARSPCSPRRIGRDALGPKLVELTPGISAKVSPRLGFRSCVSSSVSTTETLPSTSPACRFVPVTTIAWSSSGCAAAASPGVGGTGAASAPSAAVAPAPMPGSATMGSSAAGACWAARGEIGIAAASTA